jgi:hypothetical protein
MAREIELLSEAATLSLAVVEKATHVAWNLDELQEAGAAGWWREEDQMVPASKASAAEISGPFPGCLQRTGAAEEFDHYNLIRETRHFLIFEPPGK